MPTIWRSTSASPTHSAGSSLARPNSLGVPRFEIFARSSRPRWYRELVALKYSSSTQRPINEHLHDLVLRLARENDGWGYSRILGALKLLGHDISRASVRRILAEAGIEPAPNRGMTWETFLKTHWAGLFASDFFHVEVLTLRGLVRYQVLFVIELATRRVEIAGVVKDAYGEWTQNMFRGLTFEDEFLAGATHLIMDRDSVFDAAVRRPLKDRGIKIRSAATLEPQFELLCRALCRPREARVSEQSDPTERLALALVAARIRDALQPRETAPRVGEPAD